MIFFEGGEIQTIQNNLAKMIAQETNNKIPEKITLWIMKKVSLDQFSLTENDN